MRLPRAWQSWRSIPKGPNRTAKLAAAAFKLSEEYSDLNSTAESCKKELRALKEEIINTLEVGELNGVRVKQGSMYVREKDVPKVMDKEAFGRWVAANEAWDVLYGRATEEGCQARWDDGVKVGGVEKHHQKEVVLSEAK